MIYLWHLLIKWSLVYSTSARVVDIATGALFVAWIVWRVSKISKGKADRAFVPPPKPVKPRLKRAGDIRQGDKVIEKSTGKECEIMGFVGDGDSFRVKISGLSDLISEKRFEEEYLSRRIIGE